jgi:hypothetical protein
LADLAEAREEVLAAQQVRGSGERECARKRERECVNVDV